MLTCTAAPANIQSRSLTAKKMSPVFRAVNLVIGKLVRLLYRAIKISPDDEPVEITDNEQRRVKKRLTVAQKLAVSLVEILLLPLVFPSKPTLQPHISEPAFTIDGFRAGIVGNKKLKVFDNALLKTKPICSRWIGFSRCLLTKQTTEIIKMLLVCRGLLPSVVRPLLLEFGQCHRESNVELTLRIFSAQRDLKN